MLNNITEHITLIDNNRVCLGDMHEYLYENTNDIHDNTKNKKYEKVLADLLLIQTHTLMSINRVHKHNINKQITSANKANKVNKKITSDNSTNNKTTNNNANKKITNNNSANKKITSANSANKKK